MSINNASPDEWTRVSAKHMQKAKPFEDEAISPDHYATHAIEPIEFILANKLGFCEGNIIKYVTRWRLKNGIQDLEKAKRYIEFLIEAEQAKLGL